MPRTLTIAGEQFNVPTAEECGIIAGAVLDAAAARQLYQVRNENVRNNAAAKVKKALENGGTVDAIRGEIEQFAVDYTFSMPGAGGGRTRVTDPVERMARSIARDMLTAHLAKDGRKRKDIEDEKWEAELERIAGTDAVQKLAKKRYQEQQKASESLLAEVNV